MKKIFAHAFLGVSLVGTGLIAGPLQAGRTALDEQVEAYASLYRNPRSGADGAARTAGLFPLKLARHLRPMTRKQKDAFLACTHWEEAHGHDAADAAFKTKIAAQLEDAHVNSLDLFETFVQWAAACTGDTWTDGDRDVYKLLQDLLPGAYGVVPSEACADMPTPQAVADKIVADIRKGVETDNQYKHKLLPFLLPRLTRGGLFSPDRLTHTLLNRVYLVGLPHDGGTAAIHGRDVSPLGQMLHDINHAVDIEQSATTQAARSTAQYHRALPSFAELSPEVRAPIETQITQAHLSQTALFCKMLDVIHKDLRRSDERVAMTGLFWMLHEAGNAAQPAPISFSQGLGPTLMQFIRGARSVFEAYFNASNATSFRTGELCNPALTRQELIAKHRAQHDDLPAEDDSATLSSDGTLVRFAWDTTPKDTSGAGASGLSVEAQGLASSFFRIHETFPTNRWLLTGDLGGMNAMLRWASHPEAQGPLPTLTGDHAAYERDCQAYKETTFTALMDVLTHTEQVVTAFLDTVNGKFLTQHFSQGVDSINEDMRAQLVADLAELGIDADAELAAARQAAREESADDAVEHPTKEDVHACAEQLNRQAAYAATTGIQTGQVERVLPMIATPQELASGRAVLRRVFRGECGASAQPLPEEGAVGAPVQGAEQPDVTADSAEVTPST